MWQSDAMSDDNSTPAVDATADDSPVPPPSTAFSLAVVVAVAAWVVGGFVILGEYSTYSDARDRSGISAPQIAQVAGEFTVTAIIWLAIALAATSIAVLVGINAMRKQVAGAGS